MNKDKIKEYVKRFETGCSNTQDVGPASGCEECLEDFAEAVDRLYAPKPSTDFTVPKGNPYSTYLMWDSAFCIWFKGFLDHVGYLYIDGERFKGSWEGVYTHWLPLPPAPDQDA